MDLVLEVFLNGGELSQENIIVFSLGLIKLADLATDARLLCGHIEREHIRF
jgi:hypothetical protein